MLLAVEIKLRVCQEQSEHDWPLARPCRSLEAEPVLVDVPNMRSPALLSTPIRSTGMDFTSPQHVSETKTLSVSESHHPHSKSWECPITLHILSICP